MNAIAMDQSGYDGVLARSGLGAVGMSEVPALTATADSFAGMIAAIALRSDRQAFAALFNHFAPRVKSYMLRLGSPPELAEELAQEALLSVWRKAHAFDPAKAAASTWIFTIARNLRIDGLRRDRRSDPVDDPSEAPEAQLAPEALVASAESEARVRHALLSLPVEQAEVVRLSFFSEKPHSEIAADLSLPLGTVKSRLRLAMGRLREMLGDLV